MRKVIRENLWFAGMTALFMISALAFALSFAIGSVEHEHIDIPANLVRAPSDMKQLVNQADVIVTGTIGASVTETIIAPYNKAEIGIEAPTFPVTDYNLLVTAVLKGSGEVASGDTVTLRQFGHLSKSEVNPKFFENFPMSRVGDSRLFVLRKNPDNTTYGLLYGPYSRFAIDGVAVMYSDLEDVEVEFARDVPPTEFLSNIQQEVVKKGFQ